MSWVAPSQNWDGPSLLGLFWLHVWPCCQLCKLNCASLICLSITSSDMPRCAKLCTRKTFSRLGPMHTCPTYKRAVVTLSDHRQPLTTPPFPLKQDTFSHSHFWKSMCFTLCAFVATNWISLVSLFSSFFPLTFKYLLYFTISSSLLGAVLGIVIIYCWILKKSWVFVSIWQAVFMQVVFMLGIWESFP